MTIEEAAEETNVQKDPVAPTKAKKLKGEPIDLSEMPDSAWAEEKEVDFIRIVGIRFGEFGKVFDYETGGAKLLPDDPVVVEQPEKGLMMGWVAKRPIRVDNTELKLRLREITRKATEGDLENYEKKVAMEKRGYERATAAISRIELPMDILRVEYTLDRRKAIVYFSAENRVDFRVLIKELVHDLKAKVELRQIGARDQAKQIGGLGSCGEETCCSRFIGKFHGVSIKMAKEQQLSLKPTKVSGMCGRLKCCLAYEYQTYKEGIKTVPAVGKCVKCKSGGGCGTVRDIDIPRQLVMVEMEDGNMVVLPASEVVEERTLRRQKGYENEKMVATSDTDAIVSQIVDAKEEGKKEE